MADFLRGFDESTLPKVIRSGIQLHRSIDIYTDNLPAVKITKGLFRSETRRVAPVTLDVIWDHLLARHWLVYCIVQSLTNFCLTAEQQIAPWFNSLPDAFRELNNKMWTERWLQQYASRAVIEKVLVQMARRRPNLSSLAACHLDFV